MWLQWVQTSCCHPVTFITQIQLLLQLPVQLPQLLVVWRHRTSAPPAAATAAAVQLLLTVIHQWSRCKTIVRMSSPAAETLHRRADAATSQTLLVTPPVSLLPAAVLSLDYAYSSFCFLMLILVISVNLLECCVSLSFSPAYRLLWLELFRWFVVIYKSQFSWLVTAVSVMMGCHLILHQQHQ